MIASSALLVAFAIDANAMKYCMAPEPDEQSDEMEVNKTPSRSASLCRDIAYNDGMTDLMRACSDKNNIKAVKKCLRAEKNVNAKDSKGMTALIHACIANCPKNVRLLVKHKDTDVNMRDNEKMTPLMYASKMGYNNVVDELIKSEKIDLNISRECSMAIDDSVEGCESMTAIIYALKYDQREVALLLSGKKTVGPLLGNDDLNRPPLMLASANGWEDAIKNLLKRGNGITTDMLDKKNAITCAVENKHFASAKILLEELKMMEKSKRDHCLTITLERACEEKDMELLDFMLENVEKLDETVCFGENVLMHLIGKKYYTYIDCVFTKMIQKIITKYPKLVNIANKDGKTPLMLAVEKHDSIILDLLLANEANIYAVDNFRRNTLLMTLLGYGFLGRDQLGPIFIMAQKIIKKSPGILNIANSNKETPLMLAAMLATKYGSTQIFDLLLKNVEKFDEVDHAGNTLLMRLINGFYPNSRDENHIVRDEDAVFRPIRSITDKFPGIVDIANKDGKTPLMSAAEKEFSKTFKLLLMYGKNIDAKDKYGNTALQYACKTKNTKIAQLFLEKYKDLDERKKMVNLPNRRGVTSLTIAYIFRSLKTIEYLIQNGGEQDKAYKKAMSILNFSNEEMLNFLEQKQI